MYWLNWEQTGERSCWSRRCSEDPNSRINPPGRVGIGAEREKSRLNQAPPPRESPSGLEEIPGARGCRNSALTLGIQHLGNVQVLLGHLEGVVEVGDGIVLRERRRQRLRGSGIPGIPGVSAGKAGVYLPELVVLDQLGAVPVDQGVEGQPVLPAMGKRRSDLGNPQGEREL